MTTLLTASVPRGSIPLEQKGSTKIGAIMKSKLDKLLARYRTGTISGTYFRRVKVLILKSNTRIWSAKASSENWSLFLSEFNPRETK